MMVFKYSKVIHTYLGQKINIHRSSKCLCRVFSSSNNNADAKSAKPFKTDFEFIQKEAKPLPKVNLQEKLKELRQEKKESAVKVKKLNWIDKRILVYMGKYKSIEDVPDQVHFKSDQVSKEDMDAVKAQLQDKGFKYFMSAEYVLTFVCVTVCTLAYVLYYKNEKSLQNVKDI